MGGAAPGAPNVWPTRRSPPPRRRRHRLPLGGEAADHQRWRRPLPRVEDHPGACGAVLPRGVARCPARSSNCALSLPRAEAPAADEGERRQGEDDRPQDHQTRSRGPDRPFARPSMSESPTRLVHLHGGQHVVGEGDEPPADRPARPEALVGAQQLRVLGVAVLPDDEHHGRGQERRSGAGSTSAVPLDRRLPSPRRCPGKIPLEASSRRLARLKNAAAAASSTIAASASRTVNAVARPRERPSPGQTASPSAP